jgi:hypothetical protein
MRYQQIKAKADEMGIPVKRAVWYRLRYLRQRMGQLSDLIDWHLSQAADVELNELFAGDYLGEFLALAQEARALALAAKEPPRQKSASTITETDIDAARNADIRPLIEFDRQGRARAPCHDDNRPSLVFLSRTGKVWCPVCDKKWSALDWLVDVEGIQFTEAVKQLTH